MSTRLIVDNSSQLQEVKDQSRIIRLIASIISYIFHPVFVPVYIILFLLYIHPTVFAGFSEWDKTKTLMQAILNYNFFPIISILLLKALNFIDSIYLNTKKDRIIPYAICMIWYFWICYVWHGLSDTPKELITLAAGIFLASVFGWMANIYFKISMHALAAGVSICFLILLAFAQSASMGAYISIGVLIAGFVCTSRFIASAHTSKEVYGGLMAGIAAQLIAQFSQGVLY